MSKRTVAVYAFSLIGLFLFANFPLHAQVAVVQLNSGGRAVSPFVADEDYAGGTTISHANAINTSKVTDPAPAAVYQTGRIGNFTYTIGGLQVVKCRWPLAQYPPGAIAPTYAQIHSPTRY